MLPNVSLKNACCMIIFVKLYLSRATPLYKPFYRIANVNTPPSAVLEAPWLRRKLFQFEVSTLEHTWTKRIPHNRYASIIRRVGGIFAWCTVYPVSKMCIHMEGSFGTAHFELTEKGRQNRQTAANDTTANLSISGQKLSLNAQRVEDNLELHTTTKLGS